MYLNLSLEYQAKDARIIPPRHVKRPASQSPHALAPTAFAARPAAHLLHTAAPALLQLPLPQSKHHSWRDNTLDSVQPFQAWFPKSLDQICSKVEVFVTVSATKKAWLLGCCTTLITGLPCFTALTASLAREPYPTPWSTIAKITLVEFGVSWKSHPIWQSPNMRPGSHSSHWLPPSREKRPGTQSWHACRAKRLVLLNFLYRAYLSASASKDCYIMFHSNSKTLIFVHCLPEFQTAEKLEEAKLKRNYRISTK